MTNTSERLITIVSGLPANTGEGCLIKKLLAEKSGLRRVQGMKPADEPGVFSKEETLS